MNECRGHEGMVKANVGREKEEGREDEYGKD